MNRQWQQTLGKITFSLLIDLFLTLLGLDDLANYSQFLFEQEIIIRPIATNCVVLCQ